MPTPASQLALQGLRDLTTLKWYVIPLLAIVFYIYTVEIKKAKRSGNWDAIYAGLTLFGDEYIRPGHYGLDLLKRADGRGLRAEGR